MKYFLVLITFVFSSCSTLRTEKELTEFPYPSKIIDAHSHFQASSIKTSIQPNKEMLSEFDESNVQKAVVHLDLEEFQKVKIIPSKIEFAICAPAVPGQNIHEVEKRIKVDAIQCIKVYLGYIPKYAYDSFYTPYYRLADKYKIPVVFHTGDTYDKMAKVKFADPLSVDEVAVEFPKVKFVIAHMGNPWFDSAAEVVYKNDNVYCDMSAIMLDDVSKEDPEAVEELLVKKIRWFYLFVDNPKKLMFGSDWPLLKIKPYVKAIQRAIPKESHEAVFYQNALEVFKFKKY